MQRRTSRRVVLMLVIFFVPFTFFYIFSLGSHRFQRLPFFGPEKNGQPYVVEDFPVSRSNLQVKSTAELKDKILIATILTSDCPYKCDLAATQMHFMVYKELLDEEKFDDVVIVSDLIDTFANPLTIAERLDVKPEKWMIYVTEDHSLWDLELDGKILSASEDPERKGKMLYTRSLLLIDKSRRVRGYYDGSQTIELKRLLDELRLLTKEYEEKD